MYIHVSFNTTYHIFLYVFMYFNTYLLIFNTELCVFNTSYIFSIHYNIFLTHTYVFVSVGCILSWAKTQVKSYPSWLFQSTN
jgi:hypothetical protein